MHVRGAALHVVCGPLVPRVHASVAGAELALWAPRGHHVAIGTDRNRVPQEVFVCVATKMRAATPTPPTRAAVVRVDVHFPPLPVL